MKKSMNTILIAFVATLFTSCMALQGGAYSQNGYDRDYGYYDNDDDYYDDDYYYGDNNRGGVSIQVFYNTLRPYGRWMKHSSYGDIWIPRVGRNFHPYATNGYWVMTNYGNTWVSDFSWGWAPFHYGRWFYDDYYGWAWIPGYEWAPAWVTWRTGGGYYGWAPMGPRMGINIHINLPINYWVFLPNRYMYHKNMHRYYPGRNYYHGIYNKTTIINNTYVYNNNRYYSGPTQREFERSSGRSVSVRRLETNNSSRRTSVSDRSVSIYRPDTQASQPGRSDGRNRGAAVNGTRSSSERGRSATIDRNSSSRSSSENKGTVNSGTRNSGVNVNRDATTRSGAGSSSRETINNRYGSSRNVAPRQTSRNRDANVSRSSNTSSSSRNNEATVRSQRSSGSSSRSGAAVRQSSSGRSSSGRR